METYRHVRARSYKRVGHGVDELPAHAEVTQFDLPAGIDQDIWRFHICEQERTVLLSYWCLFLTEHILNLLQFLVQTVQALALLTTNRCAQTLFRSKKVPWVLKKFLNIINVLHWGIKKKSNHIMSKYDFYCHNNSMYTFQTDSSWLRNNCIIIKWKYVTLYFLYSNELFCL